MFLVLYLPDPGLDMTFWCDLDSSWWICWLITGLQPALNLFSGSDSDPDFLGSTSLHVRPLPCLSLCHPHSLLLFLCRGATCFCISLTSPSLELQLLLGLYFDILVYMNLWIVRLDRNYRNIVQGYFLIKTRHVDFPSFGDSMFLKWLVLNAGLFNSVFNNNSHCCSLSPSQHLNSFFEMVPRCLWTWTSVLCRELYCL